MSTPSLPRESTNVLLQKPLRRASVLPCCKQKKPLRKKPSKGRVCTRRYSLVPHRVSYNTTNNIIQYHILYHVNTTHSIIRYHRHYQTILIQQCRLPPFGPCLQRPCSCDFQLHYWAGKSCYWNKAYALQSKTQKLRKRARALPRIREAATLAGLQGAPQSCPIDYARLESSQRVATSASITRGIVHHET